MNEINSLGVKKIEETEHIRKMLNSLRRPDYDLVTTILYEKELSIMIPNQVPNKVTAHELRKDIKSRAPPSSSTHSALTSKQERMLKKWQSKEAQVKRKRRMKANAPQVMKKESCPPNLRASENQEQKLEEDQLKRPLIREDLNVIQTSVPGG